MRKPLLALAVAAFGIGTTEFIIMGLLPDLARDFSVSIPKAGTLVSAYALAVTIGSPLLVLALAKVDRKRALILLMLLFVVGNSACALAPTFGLLLTARILTALMHGSFFGIGSIVAANVVPREQRAQAVAIMFSGLTLANVLGVPAGTALGQAYGWRMAFWAIVPIGLVAAVAVWRMVPHQHAEPVHIMQEMRSVARKEVLVVLSTSVLSSTAMFCILTYITPILENVTHVSPHGVTLVLVAFGVAITVGNLLGGIMADRHGIFAVIFGFLILVVLFLLFPLAEQRVGTCVAAIMVWGALHFAVGAPLQTRVVDQAEGAQNLASTLNQGAFNLGNALGATLGAGVLTAGFGYRDLAYASAAVAAIAAGAAAQSWRLEQRQRAT
ncbi:MAG: MFS transporter [Janthinobacterium lividum]